MNTNKIIALRIKDIARSKGITVNKMLTDCGLSNTLIKEYNEGKDMFVQDAIKIARYLDVSLDYLVGSNDINASY